MNNLNERIRDLRTNNKLTQKQLADVLSVNVLSVQRFEYGTRKPSLENLIALADYFNVSIDYLVGRTDVKNINE